MISLTLEDDFIVLHKVLLENILDIWLLKAN